MLQRAEVGEVVETMDAWGGTGDVSRRVAASRLSYLAFNDKEGREALDVRARADRPADVRCTRRHWVEALPADPKVQARLLLRPRLDSRARAPSGA